LFSYWRIALNLEFFLHLQPNPNATDAENAKYIAGTVKWITGYLGESDDPGEPLTAIYYPIVTEALTMEFDSEFADTKIVGVLAL
jgi:hypothetical protein